MTFYLPVANPPTFHGTRQHVLNDMLFDFSHQQVSDSQLQVLLQRAENMGLLAYIADLQQGNYSNATEQRLVLHPALRNQNANNYKAVMPFVRHVLDKMEYFCQRFCQGHLFGVSGKSLKQVVCVGVGGSDLGPRMVIEALYAYRLPDISIEHVSNLDAADLQEVLDKVDISQTLFVIGSKTFTTAETVANFNSILNFVQHTLHVDPAVFIKQHMVALTAAPEKALDLGFAPEHVFEFWDWVGGRFSLWSSIGLPIALAVGMPVFKQLLAGAASMDEHFFNAPLAHNIPVLMALLGIYNIEQLDAVGLSIAPYSHRLRSFSAYLQQLEMESNGKRLQKSGEFVSYHTAPIVFGDAGTNGQHAYFQMLHQGTRHIPTDFIAVIKDTTNIEGHHNWLLANCFAQSEALAQGKLNRVEKFKSCAGGQRSTTILLPELNAFYLGMLLAAYEHKVFVQSVVWNINAFDQWGVELGKSVAKEIYSAMQSQYKNQAPTSPIPLNPVTQSLLEYVQKIRAQH